MSDSPYDVDGALKWAETSKEMNKGTNPAELENAMDYVALQTLADEVKRHKFIKITERLPEEGVLILAKFPEDGQWKDHYEIVRQYNGNWYGMNMEHPFSEQDPIAWQPLPEA